MLIVMVSLLLSGIEHKVIIGFTATLPRHFVVPNFIWQKHFMKKEINECGKYVDCIGIYSYQPVT